MKLANHFGCVDQIYYDRPLTHDRLMQYIPSVLGENKYGSHSGRYTYIPAIALLGNLQHEGSRPFFICQTHVRDVGRHKHTKHVLRLRREDQTSHNRVPKIILFNDHDSSSSYQILPGLFHSACCSGSVCGESPGEVRISYEGNVVKEMIEDAYGVLSVFDQVEEKRDVMQSLVPPPPMQQALAEATLTYRFDEGYQPVTGF